MFKVLASVFKMCVGLYINRKIAGPKDVYTKYIVK